MTTHEIWSPFVPGRRLTDAPPEVHVVRAWEAGLYGRTYAEDWSDATGTPQDARSVALKEGDIVFRLDGDRTTGASAMIRGAGVPVDVERSSWSKGGPRPKDMGVIEICVEHEDAREFLTPNSMVVTFVGARERDLSWHPVPGLVSVISGEPAVRYVTSDVEVALTVDELAALVGRELRPDEVAKLVGLYGENVHDWHDDFYGAAPDFEALQPKGVRAGLADFAGREPRRLAP